MKLAPPLFTQNVERRVYFGDRLLRAKGLSNFRANCVKYDSSLTKEQLGAQVCEMYFNPKSLSNG
jgi:hypothetical protein